MRAAASDPAPEEAWSELEAALGYAETRCGAGTSPAKVAAGLAHAAIIICAAAGPGAGIALLGHLARFQRRRKFAVPAWAATAVAAREAAARGARVKPGRAEGSPR